MTSKVKGNTFEGEVGENTRSKKKCKLYFSKIG
jgi:hypothetical protein